MWKLTTCENDISEMAYVQRGFERAQEEAEGNMWRLADDPTWEASKDPSKDEITTIKIKRKGQCG
jgi:hypothetical protein